MYIEINEHNNVLGYSTTQTTEKDILIPDEDLEKRFLNLPIFYDYINGKLILNEEREEAYFRKKNESKIAKTSQEQKITELEEELKQMKELMFKVLKQEK